MSDKASVSAKPLIFKSLEMGIFFIIGQEIMKLTNLANKITVESKETLDRLAENSGRHKARIIEAAFAVFEALPPHIQDIMARRDHPDRDLCLSLLSGLAVSHTPPRPDAE